MSRAILLRTCALLFLCAAPLWAQENPLIYANISIEGCGKLGALLAQSSGSGQRAGRTTQYRSAGFEIACEDQRIGQIDIQTADNDPAVVTFRETKGAPESQMITDTEVEPLVHLAIRAVCSCSAP